MSFRTVLGILLTCALQAAAACEDEIKFVEGLTEAGFPNLAEKVLSRTLEQFPQAEDCAPELRIRILIADKKFDEADDKISNVRNPEPLWLFLAESTTGDLAVQAYQNYFKTAEHPDDQAIFHYGTLLEERGDDAAAIELYEKSNSRPVKARLAALLVESDPDRALALAEEVQLGGLDLWFAQAVVTWAQVKIQNEEWDETQAVLEGQLELLRQISDAVPPSAAPLAGARYLLGECYEHAGKPADALHQFYNVYAKYGDSEWGPRAHEKANALIAQFEAQGKTVKIDLGGNLSKMEESSFRVARRLFFNRQYVDAVPATLAALNKCPEGEESITALRELAVSAIHLNDDLNAQMVGAYLAERFVEEPKAGDALLAAGKAALDSQNEELAWMLYNDYLNGFPQHPRAPAVLYSLSGLRDQEDYLFRIVDHYPESTYSTRALGRLAWNAFEAEDYTAAAERFAPYVDTETDPHKQTRARFAVGECYRNLAQCGAGFQPAHRESAAQERAGRMPAPRSEHWKKSLTCFQTLEASMEQAAAGFGVSKETLEFNQPYWEKSMYYQAVCHKELGETDAALKCFDRFANQFPESEIFDQVRFTKAKTLIDAERFADALPALDGLDGKFSEPVCYYRGAAQYETGAYKESFQTLEKFLAAWPASAFTYEAMFVQGRAYTAAGRTDDAIRVFGDIMNLAIDDELTHRASLELGRAQTDPSEKLASFQRVALLADPSTHADLIAEALFESLPLYLELDRPADLIADADRLILESSTFVNNTEIDELKTAAQKQLNEQEASTNLH